MSTEITVRRAVPSDAEGIRQVGLDTWPETYSFAGAEFVRRGLAEWWSLAAVTRGIAETRTFVAVADEEIIGMGNIDLRPNVPVIWRLYVRPRFHGIGAGGLLMSRLLDEAPDGVDVTLEYIDGNERAARFYAAHGFIEERRTRSPDPGWPDQVWMVKSGRVGG